jgi:hypothetical protein
VEKRERERGKKSVFGEVLLISGQSAPADEGVILKAVFSSLSKLKGCFS